MGVPNGYTSAQVVQAVPTGINSALVFVARTTFSAASSLAIANCFSSTYDNYLVQVTNLVASADAGEARVQLGNSGSAYTGSTYDGNTAASNNGAVYSYQYLDTNHWKMIGSYVGQSGYPSQLNMNIAAPNLAQATTVTSTNFGNRNVYLAAEVFSGSIQTSTQYTDFFLVTAGAPTHSCTITVYGYANS